MLRKNMIGELSHNKGTVIVGDSKYSFASWDFLQDCVPERCKLLEYCNYLKSEGDRKMKCRVQQQYMINQRNVFMELIERSPEIFIMQAVGDHILPLYYDLCKVKMEIAAWEGELMYADRTGKLSVMPLMKEKREIMMSIWKVMKESGVMEYAKKLGYYMPMADGMLPGIEVKNKGYGDGGYVDDMYAE